MTVAVAGYSFENELRVAGRRLYRAVLRLVTRRLVARLFGSPAPVLTTADIARLVGGALKAMARRAFRITVGPLTTALRAAVPVRTGALRASIKVVFDGRRLTILASPVWRYSNARGRTRGWASAVLNAFFRGSYMQTLFRRLFRVVLFDLSREIG